PVYDATEQGAVLQYESGLQHRHRDAQHAAGGARVGLHGVHVHGGPGRVRRYGHDLHPPEPAPYGGLHHRALRLTSRSGACSAHDRNRAVTADDDRTATWTSSTSTATSPSSSTRSSRRSATT